VDIRCDGRATQRLLDALLINRKSLVLNKILPIVHKSPFGEAAAKSDCARSGFVHAVGKTSSPRNAELVSGFVDTRTVPLRTSVVVHLPD
jgi:hypothetical protein